MTEKVDQDAIYKTMSTTTSKATTSLESQFTFRSLWEKVTTKNYGRDSVKATDKENSNTDRKKQKDDSSQVETMRHRKTSYPSTLASLDSLPVMFANSFTLAEIQPVDKSKDPNVQENVLQSLFTRCAKMAAIMEARDPASGEKSIMVELPEELFEGMECRLSQEEDTWKLSIKTEDKEDKEMLLDAEDILNNRFQELGLGGVVINDGG